MNPHFIFNTLFSIQTYMLENDAISASRFLSRFAKLMRHILENSKHEFVTLENEIEFLNNYLFIQQLRFNESFAYEVIFDEEEESSQINVPPMLSQPFVENSIDHGIRNIDWKGKIVVAFSIKENNLIVTIEDNGLGFYHKKQKNEMLDNHQSTGIENARQRITLLNNKYKTEHLFEIRDYSKESPTRYGTIVTFAIPLIYV
jgi:LytS/YehU family sensor histidine kinase